LEYDYIELKRERSRLSPRAVSQDWGNQLEVNIKEHRKFITDKKVEAVFEDGLLLRRMEEAFDKVSDAAPPNPPPHPPPHHPLPHPYPLTHFRVYA
jgi:hypothetical protein